MKKTKFKMPDAYVLLLAMAIVFVILGYIVPTGEYNRVLDEATGRMIVDPTSFHYVDRTPVSFFGIFQLLFKAFVKMRDMIFLTFIVAGVFGIIQSTGAIDAGISALVSKVKGKEKMAIPILIFLFSLFGAIMGCAEEMLPFYPIVVALAIGLGFDSLTGIAIVLCGTGTGFASAMLNPYTIGTAHAIAGLPLFSGIEFRLICYVLLMTATITFTMRHAGKILKDPTSSPMYNEDRNFIADSSGVENVEFTLQHKLVFVAFALGLAWISYGVVAQGFGFVELSAVFLMIGIAAGIIAKLGANGIVNEFVKGMSGMVYGAMVIGVAATIGVAMEEGLILDTVVHALASLVEGFTPMVSGVLMFVVQSFINFFIPSGSGQATVSMPIMAPLADIIGITRQTAVLAFQFGDGFSNVLYPTVGYMMAGLALGGVPYPKWAKFVLPLFLTWSAIGAVLVAISVAINYGPF